MTANTQVLLNRPADAFAVSTSGYVPPTEPSTGSGPTANQIAIAVRQILITELNRIDASISSRMPDNDVIDANVVSVKGIDVTGEGTKRKPWGPV
jgi:hypothetical protein